MAEKLTRKELLEYLDRWGQFAKHRHLVTTWEHQAYNQIKEQLQQKTVTMTEIENAVGDTSDEYTEGVIELFESKGFEVVEVENG